MLLAIAVVAHPREDAMRGREREILDAAKELIGESGVEALTMRRLGQHCQIAAAGIYYYFASREELIRSLHDELFEEFASALGPPPAPPDSSSVSTWLAKGQAWLIANPVLLASTRGGDEDSVLVALPDEFVETLLAEGALGAKHPGVDDSLRGFANNFAVQILRAATRHDDAVDLAKFLTGVRVAYDALGAPVSGADQPQPVISLTDGHGLHTQ